MHGILALLCMRLYLQTAQQNESPKWWISRPRVPSGGQAHVRSDVTPGEPHPILLLAVAVLWAARAGNIAKGITIAAGALVGVSMLGLATGTSAADIGRFIVNLIRQG